uniref:histone-lysine N-methyltransferase NSD2-like n=1 Tax=Myxine glutinosa TaxID=7769 RepID=UPI00358F1EFA
MDHSSGLSSCAMGNTSSHASDGATPGPDGSDMVASSANSCPTGGGGGDSLRRCNGHLQSTDGPLAILQQAVAQMSNGAGLQPEGQTPVHSTTPPSTPGRLQTCPSQSGSPEIKLRITKTYLDGKPLFESSLCGESTDEADVSLPIANQQPEATVGHTSTEAARPPTPPGSQGTITPVEGQLAPDVVAEKPSVPSDVEQYHAGDLVWAKIRGHPWWPCMVSHDPKLCIHFQLKEMSKTTSRRYHMQFFGPAAERAWLVDRSVVAYKGLEQYDELVAELARRASSATERAKVTKPMPPRVKIQWDVAVAEVGEAALLDREERLETFTFFYFDPKEEKANRSHKKAQPPTKRAAGKIGQAGKETDHLSPNLQEKPVADDMAAVGSLDKLDLRLAEPSTQGEDQAMALFARFCQNQQGLIQQEFPGASPGELQAILSSRWDRLSAQEKASCGSNHVVNPSGFSRCRSISPSQPDIPKDSLHHLEELHPRKRKRQDGKSDCSLPLPPGREMSGKTPARPICKGAVQMSDNCKPLKKRGLASMGTSCSPSDVDEDLAAPGEPSSDPEVSIGAFDAASTEVNEDTHHGSRRIRRDICQVRIVCLHNRSGFDFSDFGAGGLPKGSGCSQGVPQISTGLNYNLKR